MLLWLWCRPVATAPVRPLAWEFPYAAGAALKIRNQNQTEQQTTIETMESKTQALQQSKFF